MALDEAIYRLVSEGIVPPTLRLFRWSPPAVSIGRFQTVELPEIQEYLNHGYPLVRRPTGGLAVLHESDLSYSITGRVGEEGLPRSPRALYQQAHEALRQALQARGIPLKLYSGVEGQSTAGLCNAVPMRSDLVVHGGEKIGGSAQIRGEGVVLQHGCVHVPTVVNWSQFESEVAVAFKRTMGLPLAEGSLASEEVALANSLVANKYGRDEWNRNGIGCCEEAHGMC